MTHECDELKISNMQAHAQLYAARKSIHGSRRLQPIFA